MGTFMSKKNRVEPISSSQEVPVQRNRVSRRLFCCCFGNKVAPVCSSTYDVPNAVHSNVCSAATVSQCSEIETSSRMSILRDRFLPDSDLLNGKLAFQRGKKPLPKIGAKSDGSTGTKDAIKETGNVKSISFAVDLNGRSIPTGIMSNAVLKPMRLRKLPEIEKKVNLARLADNLDGGKSSSLTEIPKTAPKPKILSKEMLERLDAEKQKEINKRCKEKQEQAEVRRQLLMDKKENKLKEAERKRLRAKENLMSQSRKTSAATADKMRRAEQRKEEMRLKKEEKNELAQRRQQNVKQNIAARDRQVSSATQENIENKMRRAEERKANLKLKADEKKVIAQRKQQHVKQNIATKEQEVSSTAQENIENKMRRVEERKAALKQKAEEKKERARIRRLRASLKSRLAKMENEAISTEVNDVTAMNESHNANNASMYAKFMMQDDAEDDESVLNGIETLESDDDSNLFNFNDDDDDEKIDCDGNNSDESDSFWNTG